MAGAAYGNLSTGYIFLFIIYAVLPLLDEFFSLDQRNPTKEEREELEKNDFYFKLALYATVVLDWVIFFQVMNLFSEIEITLWTTISLLGFIFIFSNLQAVGFAVAHEIFHKQGDFNKYLGTIHMLKNLYVHFTYEHLYGHHRRVATP